MTTRALERAVLAWNRDRLDLAGDETLVRVLDRGSLRASPDCAGSTPSMT